jgi:hypothetical protein
MGMGDWDVVTESEIKNDICTLLEKYPERILFTVTPPKRTKYSSKRMKVGWPDLFGVIRKTHHGKYEGSTSHYYCEPFFIEVKKPGGTLSLEQHKILEQAKAMGAITCVATCVEDVRGALGI